MGRGRTLREWLLGESFSGWYIPTEEELYAVFLKETESEFKSLVGGESADAIWEKFLDWCIKHSDSACRRLDESRLYSRQRDYYSQNLPARIWLKLFNRRFSGMSI